MGVAIIIPYERILQLQIMGKAGFKGRVGYNLTCCKGRGVYLASRAIKPRRFHKFLHSELGIGWFKL